jgi:hypothetical protein
MVVSGKLGGAGLSCPFLLDIFLPKGYNKYVNSAKELKSLEISNW